MDDSPARAQGRLAASGSLHSRPPVRRILTAWAGCFAGEAIAAVAFGVLAYRSAGATGVAFLVAVQLLPTAVLAPVLVAIGRAHATRAARPRRRRRPGRRSRPSRPCSSEAGAPREALFALAAAADGRYRRLEPAPPRAPAAARRRQPGELTAGGVVIGVVQATAQTAGPLLAALLFSVSGATEVLAAAAVCFAGAALAEARLPDTTRRHRPAGRGRRARV